MSRPVGKIERSEEEPFPGPQSRRLRALRDRWVSSAPYHVTPLFAARGRGAVLEDVDGNSYIDFAGGIGVLNVGHCHPRVVSAVKEQAERLIHTCFHVAMYEQYVELARRLAGILPGSNEKKALLVNSGAEAVENAVKIARAFTGRPAVIAFDNSFHGRTLLALTLTGKQLPYRSGFGPYAPEVHHVPYPYCYRCAFGLSRPSCGLRCLSYLREAFQTRVSPETVAAIVMEPVQGEGGFIVPPREFVEGVEELCREHGILLVMDEIQTGFGRTGEMLACSHWGVEPDLVLLAKSIAGGLPLAAVVGRADAMDAPVAGGLGGTYGGNPVACAAALAVLDIFEKERLCERAREVGRRTRDRLIALQERCELVGEVRSLGAMVAVEFVTDRRSKEPASSESAQVIEECWRRGLVVMKAGLMNNVIRFLTPLVISDDELEKGLDVFEQALAAVTGGAS